VTQNLKMATKKLNNLKVRKNQKRRNPRKVSLLSLQQQPGGKEEAVEGEEATVWPT